MPTEDQAKKMRCCGPEGCGKVRVHTMDENQTVALCIASGCMAWRWDDIAKRRPATGPTDEGFCGLAGKP